MKIALGDLEPVLELCDPLLEQDHPGLELVGPSRAGNLRIPELSLQRREEVHGIPAAVGPGDLPLFFAE